MNDENCLRTIFIIVDINEHCLKSISTTLHQLQITFHTSLAVIFWYLFLLCQLNTSLSLFIELRKVRYPQVSSHHGKYHHFLPFAGYSEIFTSLQVPGWTPLQNPYNTSSRIMQSNDWKNTTGFTLLNIGATVLQNHVPNFFTEFTVINVMHDWTLGCNGTVLVLYQYVQFASLCDVWHHWWNHPSTTRSGDV
jgi:hypothetical protein